MRFITKVLGSAGILMIVAATIRWSFVYFDLSQLIQANIIGIIFIGFAFIYEWIKNKDVEDSIRDKKIKKMKEEIKKEILDYISS
ncbi:hypothetical protein LCGC14_0476710 [marine sediment metagenome]|uniref:Uncharacterized protein n=1 Tax=marine sediment metagenome TaxID=412755 RepID=A0A0F9VJG3_9ZZZZ